MIHVMDLTIALTCEYIFDKIECVTFLTCTNIDPKRYEYVYEEYDIDSIVEKKKVRKLIDVDSIDLSAYSNVMKIVFDTSNKIHTLPKKITNLNISTFYNHDLPIFPTTLIQFSIMYTKQTAPKLPDSIRFLSISGECNNIILPSRLLYLSYGVKCHMPVLPTTLTHLKVDSQFRHRIRKNILPDSLISLNTGYLYKYKLPALPMNLKILKLNPEYNHKFSTFPDSLKQLKLSYFFKHKVPTLPDNLTHLVVNHLNKNITVLPPKLIYLEWQCNRKIPDLTNTITHLIIGNDVNQNITQFKIRVSDGETALTALAALAVSKYINKFPDNLVHLKCGHKIHGSIPFLPRSLTYLNITYNFDQLFFDLPNNITHFVFHINMKTIPKRNNNVIKQQFYRKIKMLATILPRLIHLEWYCDYKLTSLPTTLKRFWIGSNFNCKLPLLPNNLEELYLNDNFNQEIELPSKLKELVLGIKFNQPLILPDSLTFLELNGRFCQELKLSSSLHTLRWYIECRLPQLPPKLKHIDLCNGYKQSIPELPIGIKSIMLSKEHNSFNILKTIYGDKLYVTDVD